MKSTDTTTATATITFEGVVSAWHERPNCEMDTKQGDRCSRPATMRINLHGCEQSLACGQHLNAWKRKGSANMRAGYLPRCAHCGRTFASFDDAYTVVPL